MADITGAIDDNLVESRQFHAHEVKARPSRSACSPVQQRPRDICMPGEQARSETGFTSHLSWPTFFAGLAAVPSPRGRFALLSQKLEKRREGPDQLASSLSQFRYRRGGGTDCSSGEGASEY